MARVIVLAGGNSNEREVSIRSGSAVASALKQQGHQVKLIDPKREYNLYIKEFKKVDVIFPALHGMGGEDGSLQELLEQNKIKFVGSDSKSSRLCFDKFAYYNFLKNHKILMPLTELVDYEEFINSKLGRNPFVIKPNDGGSSIDTLIIRDVSKINQNEIKELFSRYDKLILQELIEGNELTVAVLGDKSLPVIEIIPPMDQEFDYSNKYNGRTKELCTPINVNLDNQKLTQELALKVHNLCGCRDLSRTDIMLGENRKQYVLETNTIPGLTDQSLVPKSAAVSGIKMTRLCDELIKFALTH
ncbi:MAG TPA: D-alanine--D-alanine ligase [Patescibacteria group bacterium]|nr:D-alanine--D-alanine ligase [Patescibacteria group bacterium]